MKGRLQAVGPPEKEDNRFEDILRSVSLSFGVIFIPVIALAVLVLLVFFLSETPFKTLYYFFTGPFRNVYSFGNMLNTAIPLIFGALGITVAMKAGSFNLGGEGQIYLGAFVSAAAALSLLNYRIFQLNIITGIIAISAGVFASSALAAISGFCKARWNTNELITSFLASSAVIPVVNYFVTGPFLDPQTSLLSTGKIPVNLRLPLVLKPSNLNGSIFIAILAVLFVSLFLIKTETGYEFRMAGKNEIFARYGGINTKLNTVLAMAISGGFHGLAGAMLVFGTYHAVIKEFSAGLGWNSLAVAMVAGFSPSLVVPASLFFAWLAAGARIAMQNTGLTFETSSIVQSVIFLLSTSIVIRNISKKRGRK
ncbi:MAG: ABC transporter permease [Treponema sp.]|jgi:simple sugar transport system permease protein|nr:ABC transporter permease [Treponema sp.]